MGQQPLFYTFPLIVFTMYIQLVHTVGPTSSPTPTPTHFPTSSPTLFPTYRPTSAPTSSHPTGMPSATPSSVPSSLPSSVPSIPTSLPTTLPTGKPSSEPSPLPTSCPTSEPSGIPSGEPSGEPTSVPTSSPTHACLPGYYWSVSRNSRGTITEKNCLPCPEGHHADGLNVYICEKCPRGTWNIGTGHTKCDNFRSGMNTHWPILIAVIYFSCHLGTFSYVFYHYVRIFPWPKIDIVMLTIVAFDRIAFAVMLCYGVFKSRWEFYGTVCVLMLPLFIDAVCIIIDQSRVYNLPCLRWCRFLHNMIEDWVEKYDPDLSSWFAHNLRTDIENGMLLTALDLVWPFVRLAVMGMIFVIGLCAQICLSYADVECNELWQGQLDGDAHRTVLQDGRVKISLRRTAIRTVLQGGVVYLNCILIDRHILQSIWVFGFPYSFPANALSATLSAIVLICVFALSFYKFPDPPAHKISPHVIMPDPQSTTASSGPTSSEQVKPVKRSPIMETIADVGTHQKSPRSPRRKKTNQPPLPPSKPISEEVVAGLAALTHERQAYFEERRQRNRQFTRSKTFEFTLVQSKGLKKLAHSEPRRQSIAYVSNDMEMEDV